jgi:superoxide reductase
MKRRNALKALAGLGVLAATTPVFANEEGFCNVYKFYRPEIKNRTKMHIKDPAHPTKGELKHTPDIKIGPKNAKGYTLVEITLGQKGIIHPSTENHWIDFIELYVDGKKVDVVVFEPGKAMGYAAFNVKLDGAKKVKAVAGCNIHGIWENEVSL